MCMDPGFCPSWSGTNDPHRRRWEGCVHRASILARAVLERDGRWRAAPRRRVLSSGVIEDRSGVVRGRVVTKRTHRAGPTLASCSLGMSPSSITRTRHQTREEVQSTHVVDLADAAPFSFDVPECVADHPGALSQCSASRGDAVEASGAAVQLAGLERSRLTSVLGEPGSTRQ